MRSPVRIAPIGWLGLFVAVAATGLAQRGAASQTTPDPTASATTARIVAAAQAVLTTLDDAGRAKVQFPFEGPQKTRWSNLPSPMFQREGLRLGDVTPAQRTAVMTLLKAALSEDGYRKVTEIMQGDEVLRKGQGDGGRGAPGPGRGPGPGGGGRGPGGPGGGGVKFGEDEYYLAFLGTPSATAPWMLQFGGHHLAINLTLAGSQASMAPSLPAAQPASYTFEGRSVRPLGNENDKAFALINALDAAQRSKAILGSRVADLGTRTRPGWTDDSARGHSRVGAHGAAAEDAAGPGAGMGWYSAHRLRRTAHGRDRREPPPDLFRVEWTDHQRQRRVFPGPGANARHRIRATGR